VDDCIPEHDPVRFIDVFVESLDLQKRGFKYSEIKEVGQMPCNPADFLTRIIHKVFSLKKP
jgi:hypothetical protein